jgi:tetratricopeptide (TPR) repeat protein
LSRAALGQGQAALGDCNRALQLDPTLAPAWLQRGVLRSQAGQLDEALTDLRRALELGADPGLVHFNQAVVHNARKDRAAALASLHLALRHRKDYPAAQQLLNRLQPPSRP